jgi:hypothetical protein
MTHHDIAVERFLPFCRTVLLGGSPDHLLGQLPLRQPDALTAEVVAALQDMINKSVMGWLIRGIGWRRLSIPDDEDTMTVRAWDDEAWGGLRLRFTAESVDMLLLAWNLLAQSTAAEPIHQSSRRWRKMTAAQRLEWQKEARKQATDASSRQHRDRLMALSLSASGDLLLHHLIFRSLHRRRAAMAGLWMTNPLNLMAFFPLGGLRAPEECAGIRPLLTGPLAPLLPWICAEWPALWAALPGPENLDALRARYFNQALTFSAWIQACEQTGQEHLLSPLIQGYADQHDRLDDDRARLEGLIGGLPLSARQPIRRQWADALEPLHAIHRCHQVALRTHPVERDGPARILLADAARLDLPSLHRALRAEADRLNDSIG